MISEKQTSLLDYEPTKEFILGYELKKKNKGEEQLERIYKIIVSFWINNSKFPKIKYLERKMNLRKSRIYSLIKKLKENNQLGVFNQPKIGKFHKKLEKLENSNKINKKGGEKLENSKKKLEKLENSNNKMENWKF